MVYITPLVINTLGGGHTHDVHTDMQTKAISRNHGQVYAGCSVWLKKPFGAGTVYIAMAYLSDFNTLLWFVASTYILRLLKGCYSI